MTDTEALLAATKAGRALLAEMHENPLPGARYAYLLVKGQIAAIEAEARLAPSERERALEAALRDLVDTLEPCSDDGFWWTDSYFCAVAALAQPQASPVEE